jgi:hypothetical protein
MKNKKIQTLLVLAFLLIFPITTNAYSSDICKGSGCTRTEVGPFMQGISQACGNSGTCSLDDIMIVFANTGNYVIGLIGAVVLLMYIIGGIYFITSGGNAERRNKGKEYLKKSTIGLLIVMSAWLLIYFLLRSLGATVSAPAGGSVAPESTEVCADRAGYTSRSEGYISGITGNPAPPSAAGNMTAWSCTGTSCPSGIESSSLDCEYLKDGWCCKFEQTTTPPAPPPLIDSGPA